MEPVWKRGRARQSHHQEINIAKEPGGSKQINSGRFWFSKRDNRKFSFLVEARTTKADSYTIKLKELKQLTHDAFFHDDLPLMNIEWPEAHEDWVLIRKVDFEEIYQTLLELEALIKSE